MRPTSRAGSTGSQAPPAKPIPIATPSGRSAFTHAVKTGPADRVERDVDVVELADLLVGDGSLRAERRARARSFSSEPAAAVTFAPRRRATWIAAVPTPPAAAVTSTFESRWMRAWRIIGIHAVRYVVRNAAPSA